MEAGIFGLVGVLLGGLITVGVEWFQDRRARRQAGIAAARLVAAEMRHAQATIESATRGNAWWPEPIEVTEWLRRADALMVALSRDEWYVVRAGYDEMRTAERTRARAMHLAPWVGDRHLDGLRESTETIRAAIATLDTVDAKPSPTLVPT